MRRIALLPLLAACIFVSGSLAQASEVQIWGSTTCQLRFLEPGNEALTKATGISVRVFGVGTGKGLIGLLEGRAPASASSETLENSVAAAKRAAMGDKKEITIPRNLEFHEITKDQIVAIVHRDNPVESLTWEQLAGLNNGRITNWREIGGPDLPVQVVTSHSGSATKSVLNELVMKKTPYAANAIEVTSTRLELNEVSRNKGAIGAVSAAFFNLNPGHTKIIKTAAIERPLALITIGPPTPEVRKIIDFYRSEEGRKYIQ
jgi:phosphate transport system substrate-binding protein